jgi:phosphoesterase RecJ-like protein
MLNYTDFQNFFKLVDEASNIIIFNSKPDGDSIGASIALNKAFKKLNKNVVSISPQPIPDYLEILTSQGDIKYADLLSESFNQYDLVILVDYSDFQRSLQGKSVQFNPAAKWICIDHHQPGYRSKLDLALIDSTAESACGIITDLFIEYKMNNETDLFDKDICFQLYAGLVSDTDYFGYANVSKDTFERAAYLLGYEFDIIPIIKQFRETLGLKAFKFIQRNIGKVVVNEEKRYAYLKIKKSDLTEDDNLVVVNEAANFLNRAIIRIIDAVDYSFVLREINDNRSSVAMRRHNNGNSVDLSSITSHFGGGGHTQSAGAVAEMHIDSFEEEIVNYIERYY